MLHRDHIPERLELNPSDGVGTSSEQLPRKTSTGYGSSDGHQEAARLNQVQICEDETQARGNWGGKLDFILSCLSYAVGLGNVWRYPFKCYQNGGGAFVFPFIIMLVVLGIPFFFLESAFGQFAGSGCVTVWNSCPLFRGLGGGMFLVSFSVSIYYNMIIAWTFFYLFSSFTSQLPWETCGNKWNTPACRVRERYADSNVTCVALNGTWLNQTCFSANGGSISLKAYNIQPANATAFNISTYKSPSDEYFHNYVLDISDGISDVGSVRWQLVLCLLLAWTIICICMIKGIKSSGKAVYFTATFPYLVLFTLLCRSVTLPGSTQGMLYYITPKWEKLVTSKVWGDAAIQIFYSLCPAWGGLITLSSYNKFKNDCLRDTYIVCVGDALTSFFAGLVIFAILGFMSYELDIDIEDAASAGPGLAFIAYPEVVTRLPIAPLWSVLFFLMLITLGLGTQFAIMNTVHTTVIDQFPVFFHRGYNSSYLMVALCLFEFIAGLAMCTQGGMFVLELMDSYSATYSVLVIALIEVLVLSWVYGFEQLRSDIKLMLGKQISSVWMVAWKFVSPLTLVGIIAFTCIQFKSTSYRDYVYPWWADFIGWCIASGAMLCIPSVALYQILTKYQDLDLLERIRKLCKPNDEWGPAIYTGPQTPARVDLAFEFPDSGASTPLDHKPRSAKVIVEHDLDSDVTPAMV